MAAEPSKLQKITEQKKSLKQLQAQTRHVLFPTIFIHNTCLWTPSKPSQILGLKEILVDSETRSFASTCNQTGWSRPGAGSRPILESSILRGSPSLGSQCHRYLFASTGVSLASYLLLVFYMAQARPKPINQERAIARSTCPTRHSNERDNFYPRSQRFVAATFVSMRESNVVRK